MARMFHRIRPPERWGDYGLFIFAAFMFGTVATSGLVVWGYYDEPMGIIGAGGGLCGLLMTWNRSRAYDRHVWYAANPIMIDDPEPTPEPLTQNNVTINAGRQVKWGIWLTAQEWQQIARATLSNKNRISRAMCEKLDIKGFRRSEDSNLIGWYERGEKEPTGWGDFCYWLVGQGVLKPALPNQPNVLTDVGIAHFQALADPPTPQGDE